jgi:putative membrane protein insertion efficiency factor
LKKINLFFRKILIKTIEIYQKHISPMIAKNGVNCKYNPTCSEYMKQAIEKYGCVIGVCKGFIRILKCNPFSKGGYDPLK